MKKILAILMIFILMLSLTITVFAEQKEDVYYTVPSKELIEKHEKTLEERASNDQRYMEERVLKDGEEYDPEKMTHDFSKLYKYVEFTNDSFRELINSDDIRKAILESEAEYYIYPCYYDGVLLENYREIIGETLNEYTGKVVFTNLSYHRTQTYADTLFTLKEDVETFLKDKGLDDYKLVYAMYVGAGLPFAILEKDDEIFLTGLINDVVKENSGYYEILNEKALSYLEKPVMTIKETNEFLDIADEIYREIRKENEGKNLDGGVGENTAKPFPWQYVAIGIGAIVLIAAGVVTFALIKKKKA